MHTLQLILPGLIILLLGSVFSFFPPKKINRWYGYRTPRSMRNQETWNVANRFSGWLMIIAGMLGMNAGLSCKYLIAPPADIITTIVVQLVALAFMIYLTERRLADLFDAKGERRELDPPS